MRLFIMPLKRLITVEIEQKELDKLKEIDVKILEMEGKKRDKNGHKYKPKRFDIELMRLLVDKLLRIDMKAYKILLPEDL